jgi:hypothetical protein
MRYLLNFFLVKEGTLLRGEYTFSIGTANHTSPSGTSATGSCQSFFDRSGHLVFPGEILSFHVLFQVTEQKEITQCEIEGIRWLRHQEKPSSSIFSMDILEVCGLALST